MVGPLGFDCGFRCGAGVVLRGGWGGVAHTLHIWLVFAHGSLALINPLYSELYKI